jgi:XTP/dITP diphosphohydrolase
VTVTIALATRSDHKAAEIRQILGEIPGIELRTLADLDVPPLPIEDDLERYETFEENALAKAVHFGHRTGLPTVADDSGLVVDVLDGEPGVRTKRLAARPGLEGEALDRANNARLLELLEGVPEVSRTAHYVCAAALAFPDERQPTIVRGTCAGRILEAPRGEGGFGYDPLFFVPELGRTFAEIPAAEKHARSHRGRAFRALSRHLEMLARERDA